MSRSTFFTAVALTVLFNTGCAGQTPGPGHALEEPGTAVEEPDTLASGIDPYQPRFGRERPVVAVVGATSGVEVTDFVVPYGILSASDVADVVALSTEPGPVPMLPALTFVADATIAEFDRDHPEGADYVVVPAVHDAEDPALTGWISEQAAKGATLIGVCDGVLVLAGAGLLEGHRATAHWYSLGGLEKEHPGTRWVRDQRYVADGKVVTTTGVSASVPVSMALVEAIAGPEKAARVASSLGVDDWGTSHDSDAYGLGARHVLTGVGNLVAFWRRETLGIEVASGVDEISLALVADAWSRTFRSSVVSVAETDAPIRTRGGLWLLPDRRSDGSDQPDRMLAPLDRVDAGSALDHALDRIAWSYGDRTAAFVALQLEYPWEPGGSADRSVSVSGGGQECSYDDCALRLWTPDVLEGSRQSSIGRFGLFRPPQLQSLFGRSDSAAAQFRIVEENYTAGKVTTFAARAFALAGFLMSFSSDRDVQAWGFGAQAVGVPIGWLGRRKVRRAEEAMSRAVWWYNRDLAREAPRVAAGESTR